MDYDSLVGCDTLPISNICLCRNMTGAVFYSVKLALKGIGEWAAVQRFVVFWFTKGSIRLVAPWKDDIEDANERAFLYVANIADRDLIIDLFERAWIPQGETLRRSRNLVLVNVEDWG